MPFAIEEGARACCSLLVGFSGLVKKATAYSMVRGMGPFGISAAVDTSPGLYLDLWIFERLAGPCERFKWILLRSWRDFSRD